MPARRRARDRSTRGPSAAASRPTSPNRRRSKSRRSRSSSAARHRRFSCGRISSRFSRKRSPSSIPKSRWARMSSRRWNISPTTRRSAGTSCRCRAERPRRRASKASKASWIAAADDDGYERHGRRRHTSDDQPAADLPSPQTPQQALARIDLPQDAIDFISQRMVPGSSLIVSDQGLGDETGEGTDFVVVTR